MARTGVLPAATDTFVSWQERGPILYHTVTRWTDSIRVGMQRNDPLVGVATVRFTGGRVASASVRWSESGSMKRAVDVEVHGDSVVVRDSARIAFPRPSGAWAVADYGMDDLLVAALIALAPNVEHSVRVLRPYGSKWDSLVVRASARDGGRVIQAVSAPNDTTTYVVAQDGTLVYQWRSRDATNERRPLEETRAFAQFLRLRGLIAR